MLSRLIIITATIQENLLRSISEDLRLAKHHHFTEALKSSEKALQIPQDFGSK